MPSLATIRAIAILVILAAVAIGASVVTHKVDNARYLTLELKVADAADKAKAQAVAKQKELDEVAQAAAVKEAESRQKIITQTVTTIKKVNHYVQDRSRCITVGLVRVLVAAARGSDPDLLPSTAGQSDDACAALGWRDLASWIVGNFGVARQNEGQLNGLQDALRARSAVKP